MTVLAIAVAGALGAVARFVIDSVVSDRVAGVWPWGTFVVNVTGSLLGGLVAGLVVFGGMPSAVRLVAGIGFAGSFTTFSTFAVETVCLAAEGSRPAALGNVVGSLVASLAAAAAGLAAAAAVM